MNKLQVRLATLAIASAFVVAARRWLSSILSCLNPFMLQVFPAWPAGPQTHGRG